MQRTVNFNFKMAENFSGHFYSHLHVSGLVQNSLVHVIVDFERILKMVQQSFQFTLVGYVVAYLMLGHKN